MQEYQNKTDPKSLLLRWDAQQTGFIEYRAERFDIMARIVANTQTVAPRILDLACGPGSLAEAMLKRNPDADIVAVDKDPVLLAIAADVYTGDDRVSVITADLDTPEWVELAMAGGKNPGRPFDAVVSATALHWLHPSVLARTYFELANMMVKNGVFLNADHLYYDATTQPKLRALGVQDELDHQKRSFGTVADDWDTWWEAAKSRPEYAQAFAERETTWAGKRGPTPKVSHGFHLETLRSAGFSETGVVWQYLNDLVVCGFR